MSTLLVASTGGHLKQLHYLYTRVSQVEGPYQWVTFDNAQSRSLLAGESVRFVRRVGERDTVNATRNLAAAHRILRESGAHTVISTGSGIALPFFVQARARRLSCHFIESAARIDGPSLTGRLISRIPGVHLYAQCPDWDGRRWNFSGSVFDSFESAPSTRRKRGIEKAVVTLGTYRAFPRLVRRLLEVLPAETEVLWQTGKTDTAGLGISAHDVIPEAELTEAMREADVVVAHAGVGTALAALEAGKCPVLVPRRLSQGEAVDDHQTQITRGLSARDLAISREADEIGYEDLLSASRMKVTMRPAAPFSDADRA